MLRGALAALALAIQAPALANEAGQRHEIHPAVRERLGVPLDINALRRPVERVKVRFVSKSGRFSGEMEHRYYDMGNGLWGVVTSNPGANGVASTTQAITVCGMFEALAVNGTTITSDLTIVLPIGKVFIPYGIESTVSRSTVVRMTAFESDVAAVCMPNPPTSFAYETASEAELKSSVAFSTPRVVRTSQKGRCEVAPALDAQTLASGLQGHYLPVTCNATNQDGKAVTREYAFLPDSGIHVLIKSRSDLDEFAYTLVDVQYASR